MLNGSCWLFATLHRLADSDRSTPVSGRSHCTCAPAPLSVARNTSIALLTRRHVADPVNAPDAQQPIGLHRGVNGGVCAVLVDE